jgi:hypothetical protein
MTPHGLTDTEFHATSSLKVHRVPSRLLLGSIMSCH